MALFFAHLAANVTGFYELQIGWDKEQIEYKVKLTWKNLEKSVMDCFVI